MQATRTLLRGLAILEALAAADEPLGPTALAEIVGLDKATVSRLLYTLCEVGYARQVDNGTYRLTTRILQLSSGVALEPELREVARPHLAALSAATEETVHLGVREGTRVIYIDKIEGRHPVRLVSAVGQTMPVHTTSLGKAALAWLPEEELDRLASRMSFSPRTAQSLRSVEELRADLARVRERGYSVDNRENEDHAICVGAPIFGADRTVIGMLSVSGPSSRMADRYEAFGLRCREAAEAISRDLVGGATSDPPPARLHADAVGDPGSDGQPGDPDRGGPVTSDVGVRPQRSARS